MPERAVRGLEGQGIGPPQTTPVVPMRWKWGLSGVSRTLVVLAKSAAMRCRTAAFPTTGTGERAGVMYQFS